MKETQLITQQMPPITPEFFEYLKTNFPTRDVKPGMATDDIMYRAGQQSVLKFARLAVVGTTITGTPQNWMQRLALKTLQYRRGE